MVLHMSRLTSSDAFLNSLVFDLSLHYITTQHFNNAQLAAKLSVLLLCCELPEGHTLPYLPVIAGSKLLFAK